MANFVFANNIKTTVASAFSNVATSLTLASSVGLPTLSAGQVLPITINDAATGLVYEICYATAITGATLTVTRAQEGTAAQNWLVGDRAYCAPTALSVAPVNGNGLNVFQVANAVASNEAVPLAQAETLSTTGNAATATNVTGSAVVTGLVQSGTNPKARAYVGGTGQNLTSGVPVQVNFSTNLYAIGITTTGGTFTPSVAGYYSVSWNLSVDSNAAITAFGVTPYFSLTSEAYGSQSFTGNFAYASGSIERYFNGTTDNFYVKVSATGTGTLSITNGLTCGMFMHLIP